MKIIKALLIAMAALCCLTARAQVGYSLSFFNNATKLPLASFSAVWDQPLHPGVCAGYEFHWRQSSPWFQTVKLGYYYHQFVQSGIQLYTDYGYRKEFYRSFFIEGAFSLGYLHLISHNEQAELDDTGVYRISNGAGRPQVMFGPSAGLGYNVKIPKATLSIFTSYHVWLQAPFVPGYVPLLPNGSLQVGVRFSVPKTSGSL
jgi:hypothetical protein